LTNGVRKRSSIFTGLLLILLGVIFLLDRYDPGLGLGHLIRIYWPVLIILWGVAKLIDHFAAARSGQPHAPFLSGAEIALMIVVAFVLTGLVFRDWLHDRAPDFMGFSPFDNSYTQTRDLPPQTIPAGAHVVIDTDKGDIAVHAGEGNDLKVKATVSGSGSSESAADEEMRNVNILVEKAGNTYHIHPVHQEGSGGRVGVDLDVSLPKGVSLEVKTNHGDIDVSGIAGSAAAHSGRGDLELRDMGSDVTADTEKGDTEISDIAGNVKISGRGNDLDLSDIKGDATVEGAFIGDISAKSIAKTLRFVSPWSDLTITNLTGHIHLDSSDIEISDATGPLKLVAHNKDIDVTNVMGKIDIVNTHGDVKVSYSNPPHEDLTVTNDSNDVDVTLPAHSNVSISATSRSGGVESDFDSLSASGADGDEERRMSGRIGSGGPTITITTSYGTIHLRKGG
jgi:Putative adhesin/Domain of unknown function (DUF5668)